jgi:hypothetical protein
MTDEGGRMKALIESSLGLQQKGLRKKRLRVIDERV